MNRTTYCILLMSLFSTRTFAQSNQEKTFAPATTKYNFASDDKWPYAILKFDAKRNYRLFGKNVNASTLSVSEIINIENLISKQVTAHNKSSGQFINKPERYYKQFIAVINAKGEKEVWVNCFCRVFDDGWKKNIEWVKDGGSCYFQLKINLTKNLVYDFFVNGVA